MDSNYTHQFFFQIPMFTLFQTSLCYIQTVNFSETTRRNDTFRSWIFPGSHREALHGAHDHRGAQVADFGLQWHLGVGQRTWRCHGGVGAEVISDLMWLKLMNKL